MLPSFASSSLPPVKALAKQTAIVGGGCGFSLYFPKPAHHPSSSIVTLSSHTGHFLRPEAFYRPASLDAMPLGADRLEAFLAFQAELLAWLFPAFCKALPLAESLGEQRFLSSVLPYSQRYESRKAWLTLPNAQTMEAGK